MIECGSELNILACIRKLDDSAASFLAIVLESLAVGVRCGQLSGLHQGI
jgi:hypothetical protein